MDKVKALNRIAKEIARCKICKRGKIGLPVPGEGSAFAKVVFIGEAPGKKEAKTGRPFIGPAGKILRALIAQAGLKDSEVFITSPVKYLPKYVTPTEKDVAHGRFHLNKQLGIIKPKFVVLMGRIACLALLHKNCPIAQDHGKIIKEGPVNYFISYHPAAPLYSNKLRKVMEKDFRKLKKLIAK